MAKQKMFVRLLSAIVLASALWGTAGLKGADQKKSPAAAPGATPKSEEITGIVTAKTDKEIMVKAEGEQKPQRHLLASLAGGLPSADVKAALKMVFPTNLVVLQWQGQPERVVTGIHAIHSKTRSGVPPGPWLP